MPWGLWALFLGLVGLTYSCSVWRRGQRLRVPVSALALPAALTGATCLFLLIQALPLGWLAGAPTGIQLNGLELAHDRISIAPLATLLMLTRQLSYALFFALTLQVCVNDSQRQRLLALMLGGIVAYAIYGEVSLQLGDTILGVPKWTYLGSATGPFVNRNSFATFLAFGAILAASQIGGALVRQHQRHVDDGRIAGNASRIALYGMALVFLLAIIVATQSRMGLFAAAFGLLVVLFIVTFAIRRARLLLILVPLLVLAGLMAALLFGQNLFERLEALDGQTDARWALFSQTMELIAQRPLLGFGGDSFELAFPLVHDPALTPDLVWSRAHNTYLSLWAELGVVVGSFPVIAIAYIACRLIGGLRRGNGSFVAPCAAIGVIVVGGVHSLADFSLEIQANTFVWLAIVAAGLAPFVARTPSRVFD